MKVGVLGSGVVGQRLAEGLAGHGHRVVLGTHHPEKAELDRLRSGTVERLTVGSFDAAAAHGELLVLCCLGTAVNEVLDLAGERNFSGKTLIDVTNPLDFSRGMPPGLFVGPGDSLGERIQRRLPKTRVVKCFNTVPNALMVDPTLEEGRPTMMIAGDDGSAKDDVRRLLLDLGWNDVIDVGGIDGARWLEALVPLWVRVAMNVQNFSSAFKVLRR